MSFIRKSRTQADIAMAQAKWRRSVKGLMVGAAATLKKIPSPETSKAPDEETRVKLSHRGVVSRRLCLGKCTGS